MEDAHERELRERFFAGDIDQETLVREVESVMRMKQLLLDFEKGGEARGEGDHEQRNL